MSDKLDWTQKLGDAFLGQQKDLMDAIQRLRAKAQAEGYGPRARGGPQPITATITGSSRAKGRRPPGGPTPMSLTGA